MRGHADPMIADILIAALIVIVGAVLGIVVHPFWWFILILAALWLFGRRGARARS